MESGAVGGPRRACNGHATGLIKQFFIIFMLVSERTVKVHKTAASMDPLTGMFNRRGFAEACARVIDREDQVGVLPDRRGLHRLQADAEAAQDFR